MRRHWCLTGSERARLVTLALLSIAASVPAPTLAQSPTPNDVCALIPERPGAVIGRAFQQTLDAGDVPKELRGTYTFCRKNYGTAGDVYLERTPGEKASNNWARTSTRSGRTLTYQYGDSAYEDSGDGFKMYFRYGCYQGGVESSSAAEADQFRELAAELDRTLKAQPRCLASASGSWLSKAAKIFGALAAVLLAGRLFAGGAGSKAPTTPAPKVGSSPPATATQPTATTKARQPGARPSPVSQASSTSRASPSPPTSTAPQKPSVPRTPVSNQPSPNANGTAASTPPTSLTPPSSPPASTSQLTPVEPADPIPPLAAPLPPTPAPALDPALASPITPPLVDGIEDFPQIDAPLTSAAIYADPETDVEPNDASDDLPPLPTEPERASASLPSADSAAGDDAGGLIPEPGEAEPDMPNVEPATPVEPQLEQAEIDARRAKYRELVKLAADAEDSATAFQLQKVMREHGGMDEHGVPHGNLEALERVVQGMLAQPPSMLDRLLRQELVRQPAEFLGGMASDAGELGLAVAKGVGSASADAARGAYHFTTDAKTRERFWDSALSATDKASDFLGKKADDFANAARQLGRDLANDDIRNAFLAETGLEAKELGRDLVDWRVYWETVRDSAPAMVDPAKLADAAHHGIPGMETLVQAADPTKPVTERAKEAVFGGVEWAFAGESLGDFLNLSGAALQAAKGKLFKETAEGFADDIAKAVAGAGDGAGARAARAAEDASEAGARALDDIAAPARPKPGDVEVPVSRVSEAPTKPGELGTELKAGAADPSDPRARELIDKLDDLDGRIEAAGGEATPEGRALKEEFDAHRKELTDIAHEQARESGVPPSADYEFGATDATTHPDDVPLRSATEPPVVGPSDPERLDRFRNYLEGLREREKARELAEETLKRWERDGTVPPDELRRLRSEWESSLPPDRHVGHDADGLISREDEIRAAKGYKYVDVDLRKEGAASVETVLNQPGVEDMAPGAGKVRARIDPTTGDVTPLSGGIGADDVEKVKDRARLHAENPPQTTVAPEPTVYEIPPEDVAPARKGSDTAYGKEWEQKQLEPGVDPRNPSVQEVDLNEYVKQWGDEAQWGERERYKWRGGQSPVVDAVGLNNGNIEYVASMAASNPETASPKYYMDKYKKLMDFIESDKRGAAELRKSLGFDGTDMELLEKMQLHVPEGHADMARQAIEYRVRTVDGGYDFWRYQAYADHLKAKGFSPAEILANLKNKIVGR